MKRTLLSTCLIAYTFITSAANPLFNVTFIKDKEGPGGYLTARLNIKNHAYPSAGITITDRNYIFSNLGDCAINPVNGWCLFTADYNHPKTFRVSRINNVQTPSSGSQEKIKVKLALNARGSKPISTEETSTAPQTPGRIIGYTYGWESQLPAPDIAAAGYTHVLIAFGLFNTSPGSIGTINTDSISGFDMATYIQSLHASGLKVLLSIGGASTNIPNTTVDFDTAVSLASTPSAFASSFMSSMASLVTTYGFDGFDFDIESGLNADSSFTNPDIGCSNSTYSSNCDISYLAYIINTFHTQYPNIMLTMAPQIANIAATSGYSSIWGNYAALVMQTHQSLEWVGFQNYNAGCAYGINLVCYPTGSNTLTSTADAAVAFATDLLANWPATTASGQATGFQPYISYLTPSQVVIGYTVNNSSGQSDGAPAAITSVTKNAIQCLRSGSNCDTYTPPTTYSGIGGVFSWTINYDATNAYQFATSLYPCVVQGNCS